MNTLKTFCALLGMGLGACLPITDYADAAQSADAGADASSQLLCEAVEPPCTDSMIQQLSLQDFASSGAVNNSQNGAVFTTTIDASAGGMSQANNNPYVYVKFNQEGAVRVDIDDETALESMDWDLAARRFIVRLNSGDSGPSCVQAASVNGDFDSISQAPSQASFSAENFYSDSCDYITDSRFSGFDGPDTILKEFWEMNGMCVATTGQVFVLRLADGRMLKLVIDAYYGSGQDGCNTSGSAGQSSGVLSLRWAWL